MSSCVHVLVIHVLRVSLYNEIYIITIDVKVFHNHHLTSSAYRFYSFLSSFVDYYEKTIVFDTDSAFYIKVGKLSGFI